MKELGTAIPHVVDDLADNIGWVSVERGYDTAEFDIDSIFSW